ncbi:hypothetical protein TYRP_005240 [Tyrophagus putrescentiae]|nr:hypothetical protein TYRP_005240 [Tyrophagus putrescentiae]
MPSAQRNTSSSLSSFSGRLPFLPRLLLLNPEMTVTWDLLRCFSRLLCIAAVVAVARGTLTKVLLIQAQRFGFLGGCGSG